MALYLARKDDRPRAKVKATISHAVSYDGIVSELPISITLEIVNVGKIPIHLAECTLTMSRFSKKRMAFLDGSHKVKQLLKPGDFYEHTLDYEQIYNYLKKENLKNLKTFMFYRDSLDNVYKAKVILRS